MGRQRRAGYRRRAFQRLHADALFRQGPGRPAGQPAIQRPFAITGQVGYAIPGVSKTTTASIDPDTGEQNIDTEFNPRVLNWGATLQYSMPYLKSAVVDLGLPDFVNQLIPIVGASLQTPVSNTATSGTVTTGTINPGVVWVANTYQVGVEAIIPVNRQSGTGVGAIGQLHLFLDESSPPPSGGRYSAMHRVREADVRSLNLRPPYSFSRFCLPGACGACARHARPCLRESAARPRPRQRRWC